MNQDALEASVKAYHSESTVSGGIAAAIETYNRLVSSELVVGELVQPQRDYRKELWLSHWAGIPADVAFTAAVASAERAVEAFDVFFKENP